MNGTLHSHKKGFSICQYVLEAKRENLLVLRIVRDAVHPVLYWDECHLVDCKEIWELVFQLWQWSKTSVFHSLEPKSPGSSLFGDLACSTSWNRPLQSFNCHGERLFPAKWHLRKMPDFFAADLILVYSDGLFVNGNLKKSGGIILHCQHDHHGVSDCSGKYPTWLDPDNYTRGGAVLASKTLHFWLMTLYRFWKEKSSVIMWPCFLLW